MSTGTSTGLYRVEQLMGMPITLHLAEPVPTELGDRRRSVHDRGREVAEQMRRGSNSPE